MCVFVRECVRICICVCMCLFLYVCFCVWFDFAGGIDGSATSNISHLIRVVLCCVLTSVEAPMVYCDGHIHMSPYIFTYVSIYICLIAENAMSIYIYIHIHIRMSQCTQVSMYICVIVENAMDIDICLDIHVCA